MAKATHIISLLERRIRHGDYLIKEIPAERELAAEFGVNSLTARKAYLRLIDKGLLVRKPNGRLEVNKNNPDKKMQIAFVVPAFSQHIDRWRIAIEQAAAKFEGVIRPISFIHWDDPVIVNDLVGFDGVFLLPSSDPIPEKLIENFQNQNPPLVALDFDLTGFGIPSLDIFPAFFVHNLLDYLAAENHKHIDCMNMYGSNEIIKARVHQWNVWRLSHKTQGRVIEIEGENLERMSGIEMGYSAMKRVIREGLKASAILCVSMPLAVGAMRACLESNIVVGKDVSICAVDGEGYAKYQNPSLTCLDNCDPAPYLAVCLDWMASGGQGWLGPLKLMPNKPTLFIGESTGPCLK